MQQYNIKTFLSRTVNIVERHVSEKIDNLEKVESTLHPCDKKMGDGLLSNLDCVGS